VGGICRAAFFSAPLPSLATPLCCGWGCSGESFILACGFISWLTELFNKLVPSPLRCFVGDQSNEDPIWEPQGQKALDHDIFVLPLLNGLTFRICGVGCILWNWTCVGSVEVAPAVHGLHGFLEMHGEDGPIGGVILERWDSSEECWKRHSKCSVTYCSSDSGSSYRARAGPITCCK